MSETEIRQVDELYRKETSLRYMLHLAAPMIVTNISFTLMQFIDRFMVSRLGTDELAAIVPAGVVSFLPGAFALGVMTSVSTYVGQNYGSGNKRECSNYCWQAIYMGLLYFAVTTLLVWPIAPAIFHSMGYTDKVVEMEVLYLRVMLLAQLPLIFSWSCSNFFMGIHRPVVTMYASVTAQIVNVTASYALIFGGFGLPKMGFEGAAWGTFIGVCVSGGIAMTVFLSSWINSDFQSRSSMKIKFSKMADLIKVGFPAGVGLLINVAIWGVILSWLVAGFGKSAQAATSAVFSWINISVLPIVGISGALTAAVGKSIGQGRKDIAIGQTSLCLKVGMTFMGLMGLGFFLFREPLMAFWSSDSSVIEDGTKILVCVAIFQVFDAAVVTYNGALRGAGDTIWLAIISMVSSVFILGLGGIAMVWFFPNLGSLGPWIAATVDVIIGGLANRWRFKSNHWMKIDLLKRMPVVETMID